jgi:hypothetical protein
VRRAMVCDLRIPVSALVGPKLCEHLEVFLKHRLRPTRCSLNSLKPSDNLRGLFKQMGNPASSFGWSLLIADPSPFSGSAPVSCDPRLFHAQFLIHLIEVDFFLPFFIKREDHVSEILLVNLLLDPFVPVLSVRIENRIEIL